MPKKVYVMTARDAQDSKVAAKLRKLGGSVVMARARPGLPRRFIGTHVVMVFIDRGSKGHFPSKVLRIHDCMQKIEKGGFEVPSELTDFLSGRSAQVIAIKEVHCNSLGGRKRIASALRDEHYRDANKKWIGDKTKRRPFEERMRIRKQERRERRGYALPQC